MIETIPYSSVRIDNPIFTITKKFIILVFSFQKKHKKKSLYINKKFRGLSGNIEWVYIFIRSQKLI